MMDDDECSCKLIHMHALKAYRGMEVEFHARTVDLPLHGDERLNPRQSTSGVHWLGDCVAGDGKLFCNDRKSTTGAPYRNWSIH
jgi:hypothetical protein